jgi:hypothetical protein
VNTYRSAYLRLIADHNGTDYLSAKVKRFKQLCGELFAINDETIITRAHLTKGAEDEFECSEKKS